MKFEEIKINRKVFYFARIKEHAGSKEKSKQLIEEQRQLKTHLEKQGFEIVLSGRVRGQMEDGQNGKKILVFKEGHLIESGKHNELINLEGGEYRRLYELQIGLHG